MLISWLFFKGLASFFDELIAFVALPDGAGAPEVPIEPGVGLDDRHEVSDYSYIVGRDSAPVGGRPWAI